MSLLYRMGYKNLRGDWVKEEIKFDVILLSIVLCMVAGIAYYAKA